MHSYHVLLFKVCSLSIYLNEIKILFKKLTINLYYKIETAILEPCIPSPCGPNSICRKINLQAVCTCISGYVGSPPTCRPECIRSSDCKKNEVCTNQKCMNPCPGTCGIGSLCQVINHSPICTCSQDYTGDPFIRCSKIRKLLT
jgi:hypothetical protein